MATARLFPTVKATNAPIAPSLSTQHRDLRLRFSLLFCACIHTLLPLTSSRDTAGPEPCVSYLTREPRTLESPCIESAARPRASLERVGGAPTRRGGGRRRS